MVAKTSGGARSGSARKPASAAKVADATAAKPDNAEELAPATEFAASGAVIEPEIVERVDMGHASVDANPRSKSTAAMNAIDFNNPSALVSQEDSVIENLTEQGAQAKNQKD